MFYQNTAEMTEFDIHIKNGSQIRTQRPNVPTYYVVISKLGNQL